MKNISFSIKKLNVLLILVYGIIIMQIAIADHLKYDEIESNTLPVYILQKTFFEHALGSAPKNRKLLFLWYYTIKIINNPMKNTIKYNIIQ